jgi:hypothetical protein
MIDHLKQLSADTEEVILATCALARRGAGGAALAGGALPLGAPDARELAKELAAAKEQLRGHEARAAEWARKVADAEEAQKVAAESFKKGQRDVEMFKQECAKLEEGIKAEKALREEAEKKVCLGSHKAFVPGPGLNRELRAHVLAWFAGADSACAAILRVDLSMGAGGRQRAARNCRRAAEGA